MHYIQYNVVTYHQVWMRMFRFLHFCLQPIPNIILILQYIDGNFGIPRSQIEFSTNFVFFCRVNAHKSAVLAKFVVALS
jgi:hypothetical protein